MRSRPGPRSRQWSPPGNGCSGGSRWPGTWPENAAGGRCLDRIAPPGSGTPMHRFNIRSSVMTLARDRSVSNVKPFPADQVDPWDVILPAELWPDETDADVWTTTEPDDGPTAEDLADF